jgi:hypothetical protein
MYQAFRCSLIWPLAGMEIRGPGADHYGGLKALCSHRAFPGPDLTDQLTLPFVALLTRLTFPKPRRPIVDQDAATSRATIRMTSRIASPKNVPSDTAVASFKMFPCLALMLPLPHRATNGS